MNEIEKLRKKQKELQKRMSKILADTKEDSLSKEDAKLYNKYDRQFDNIGKKIEKLEKIEAREAELDKAVRNPLIGTKDPSLGLDEAEVKRYSLFNVIRAIATNDFSEAQYELELSNKIADKVGVEARGVYIPTEVQRSILSTGTAGALVGTDHRDDLFIESLREDSFVLGMGAKLLTELVGDVDIPKAMGGMNFDFISEDDDSPEKEASFETVSLTPKTASGSIVVTRKLLKQSSPQIEKLLEEDMRLGMALMIDKAVLAGDGTGNNPTGILSTTGVNTVTVADTDNGVPTFAESVKFETELGEHSALRGSLHYVTTPSIAGSLKSTPLDEGSGIMINTNNTVNGYPIKQTNLITDKKTIFGNFEDVIVGMWGTLDLVVDTATRASKGGVVLRAWQDIDVAIRHPESFTITGA